MSQVQRSLAAAGVQACASFPVADGRERFGYVLHVRPNEATRR
ncbi:MAG: hypothetical protein R3F56_04935 [Planctomycetota bacterium]